MFRIGILVLGMASLAASGILTDRNRMGLNTVQGTGLNSGVYGLGVDRQNILTRDDLLKQKFILDVLEQIQLPLQNQELLQLGVGDITNEDLYIQPLDEDVILMLNLLRNNQVIGKNVVGDISNVQHLRQMVGLYRLFLNARDFQTLQRIIVYARQNLNTELFVNSLVIALAERHDTKMLIIPALYEILPQVYQDQDLIEEIRNIGDQYLLTNSNVGGVSSIKPNLLDVVTQGRQSGLYNSRIPEMGGIMNILNKSQFWMPWREFHRQIAMRKLAGLKPIVQDQQKLDKLVISQPIRSVQNKPLGLFTEDLGLKSYFNILIDELIVKQSVRGQIGNTAQNIGIDQERNILEGRKYDTSSRFGMNRDEYWTNTGYGGIQDQRRVAWDSSSNTDRPSYVGRRPRTGMDSIYSEGGMNLNQNEDRDIIGQRRNEVYFGRRVEDDTMRPTQAGRGMYVTETKDRDIMGLRRDDIVSDSYNDRVLYEGRRLKNRVPFGTTGSRTGSYQDQYMSVNQQQNIMSGQGREEGSVSWNDNRLLFSGRRRKNLSGIPITNKNYSEDYSISGGRHVTKDEQRDRKSGRDERKQKYIDDESPSYNRRRNIDDENVMSGKQTHATQDYQDILGMNRNYGLKENSYGPMKNRYDINDEMDRSEYYRNLYGQGGQQRNSLVGKNRDNYQTTTTTTNRGNLDERQRNVYDDDYADRYNQDNSRYQSKYMQNDYDLLYGKGRVTELPTTTINDERLLHINRRRLNEIDEGRQVGNMEEGDRKYVDRYGDRMQGGRTGGTQEEGNRKYVDRDVDHMRGSRIGIYQEEGDRKYVDRDDISMYGQGIGINQEEGNRKYMDRDGDRMRAGGIGINQQEGNRKYVDKDYDSMRGGNIYNRFEGQDNYKQERLSQRKESDNFQRYRRSLTNYGPEQSLNGKLLLHNLQQLVARINIEHISLGQSIKIDDYLQVQGITGSQVNDISNTLGINRGGNLLVLQKINDVAQRLELALKQQISRISGLTYEQQINEVGLILARHILDLGVLDIFSEVLNLDQLHQEGHLSNILQNPINQLVLSRLMKTVDTCVKDLHQDEDVVLRGVTINNVQVDKLQTYLEYADVDLTNLLESQQIQRDIKNTKMVVGRIPRLNHKSFDIKLDVSSDREQRVVIRTFLGPKIDALGNTVTLKEQRQNYILLDINAVDLVKGGNTLKFKSKDITWTTRDTSSYTEIYERVMRALESDVVLNKDLLIGQNNLFPHRLLIPRGRINGLPMQLLTVITPVEESYGTLGGSLVGLDSLLLDRLPLNYPLDGDIQNLNSLLSIPNVYLQDVVIYHEDHIKLPLLI